MAESPNRPPRPLAELALQPLADGDALAKAWLVQLVQATPLAAVPAIPLPLLAARAPEVCAAVVAGLRSDRALERIVEGGDLEPTVASVGRLVGARSPAATAIAVARLRDALLETVDRAVGRLDVETTVALAARVAHVCDVVLLAALRDREKAPSAERPPALAEEVDAIERPWMRAIHRLLAEEGEQQAPFAVLAVEVDDADRLLAADREGATEALADVERAVRAAMPSTSVLIRERPGRLWIVAPGARRAEAQALARRVAGTDARPSAPVLHGVPLALSVGLALCPDDAIDADALAALADEALFAARAEGLLGPGTSD